MAEQERPRKLDKTGKIRIWPRDRIMLSYPQKRDTQLVSGFFIHLFNQMIARLIPFTVKLHSSSGDPYKKVQRKNSWLFLTRDVLFLSSIIIAEIYTTHLNKKISCIFCSYCTGEFSHWARKYLKVTSSCHQSIHRNANFLDENTVPQT